MQAVSFIPFAERAVDPADHMAIVDALYRFAAGQDLCDRALFESAFADDAVLDFTQPAKRLGVDIPVFKSRAGITDAIFGAITALDTTHTVTNPRVTDFDGRHATMTALVEAQHLPRGDHSRHLMLKNIYRIELSRAVDAWVMDHVRIENVWMDGDPKVLFPNAG
ncbi:MAG TPA: nuclear transport factor 2 family protein [Rhodanobacteraceae bacterium]|nr:nuclear transport factor 2 family protein [Rhodanobacteraceae bacterium]